MSEPSKFSNIIDLCRQRAGQEPDKRIITFLADGENEHSYLTIGQLDEQARTIAARLQAVAGIGDRAVLLYPPGIESINAFIGCIYAGVVPIIAEPPISGLSPDMLLGIVADAQPKFALTTFETRAELQNVFRAQPSLTALQILVTDRLVGECDPNDWRQPRLNDDSLAYLMYTSGSTKVPRGVMYRHRTIAQTMREMKYEPPPDEVSVNWMSQYHTSGLSATGITPMISGVPVITMPTAAFMEQPRRWLQAMTRYRGTSSGAPNFAYQLCVERITPAERQQLDLSSWKIAYLSMEPVHSKTLDQFTEAFSPCGFRREAFLVVYGLSESSMVTWAANPKTIMVSRGALKENQVVMAASEDPDGIPLVSCGAPYAPGTFEIVDPESLTRCPPDRVGEIWISGSSAMDGYLNKPAETKDTFNAFLAGTGEGPFLRTGDLGFFKEGELYIAGRLKDMIIIRGRNYYAVDIEQIAARTHPALMPGAAAAFGVPFEDEERLAIIHEIKPGVSNVNVEEVAHAIREAVGRDLGLPLQAVVLVKHQSLPRTPSGKIRRYLARAQFLASDFRSGQKKMNSPSVH